MNSNITFSLLVCVSCLMLAIHGRMFLMDEEDLATLARSRRDAPAHYTPRVVHAPAPAYGGHPMGSFLPDLRTNFKGGVGGVELGHPAGALLLGRKYSLLQSYI